MKTVTERFSYVKSLFGKSHIARNGIDVAVKCPYCSKGTDKKKLSINLETWYYHCWVCGVKGKNVNYLIRDVFGQSESEKFSAVFYQALISGDVVEKEAENFLPKGFKLLCDDSFMFDPDFRDCRKYLLRRGVSKDSCMGKMLGTVSHGRFKRRVIIPSFDYFGDLNYFSSRSIDRDVKPKYLNLKANRRDIVFNEIGIDWSKEVTIVEGPFDYLKAGDNATCLLGSHLDEKYALFARLAANKCRIILALDRDALSKSMKIASLLTSYCCDVKILMMENSTDVGDMSPSEFTSVKSESVKFNARGRIMHKISSIKSGSLF